MAGPGRSGEDAIQPTLNRLFGSKNQNLPDFLIMGVTSFFHLFGVGAVFIVYDIRHDKYLFSLAKAPV
jgi:hypothetical protein